MDLLVKISAYVTFFYLTAFIGSLILGVIVRKDIFSKIPFKVHLIFLVFIAILAINHSLDPKNNGYNSSFILTTREGTNIPVYQKKNENSKILGYTKKLDVIEAKKPEGGWIYLRINSQLIEGWVKEKDLRLSSKAKWKRFIDLSTPIFKEVFSLKTLIDIIIGLILSRILVFLFGKIWAKKIDNLFIPYITGFIIILVSFRKTGDFVKDFEIANTVMSKVMLAITPGFFGGAIEELIVCKNKIKGFWDLIIGLIISLFFIFYHYWLGNL